VLSQADAALASAEAGAASGVREVAAVDHAHAPHNAEQWSRIIAGALEQRRVHLASFPVADLSGQLVHRECPLRLRFSADGEWQPAGRFLPIAERLELTAALDLAAIGLGLDTLQHDESCPGLAINLSARSVQDPAFRQQLRSLLAARPAVSRRLWLEVNEHGALTHFEAFRSLCGELAGTGCRLGLEHFGRMFSQIGRFHDLGLDYLKVDASFIRQIESNPGNQSFLKGLTGIAHNIGLKVYAEGVASAAELQALGAMGFDGATGPAVKDPA
jgi:EAL domain-containing protein (putative c-di-GMP-specific phosphodiesterase class I)